MSITRKCSTDGCNNEMRALKMCRKHYERVKKYGSTDLPAKPDKCSVDRCTGLPTIKGKYSYYPKGMCHRHYSVKRREERIKYSLNKLGGKCAICSSTDNLEFDHVSDLRNGNLKRLISQLISCSYEKLDEELKLCQILCKKCHISKTISDMGARRSTHGMPSMYTSRKCRCPECKKAWALYQKNYQRRRRAIMKLQWQE